MEKEFVPYELALKMKQLGFDEPCLGHYQDRDETTLHGAVATSKNVYFSIGETNKGFIVRNSPISNCVLAPTYSQAFRWFREKYDFSHSISKTYRGQYMPYVNGEELLDMDTEKKVDDNVIDDFGYKWLYDSYEEAETACLQKLIEIVEQTNP
jgi:hypothetical protein